MKTTVVIGASENPDRFSYRAVRMLRSRDIPVEAIGIKAGTVADVTIRTGFPIIRNVDTVTLYVGPGNQPAYYDYIIGLKPERVIFNPGTENPELERLVRNAGIEVLEACTLTMLAIGTYK